MIPKTYELWFADFPFEEDTSQSKDRPVVLLERLSENRVRALMVTSSERGGDDEMPIEEWKVAGLGHRSVIRISRAYNLNASYLRRKIGTLSEIDAIRLKFRIG